MNSLVAWLVILRVPIGMGLALFLGPFLLSRSQAVGNALVLEGEHGVFGMALVVAFALLLGAAVGIAFLLAARFGPDRFGLSELPLPRRLRQPDPGIFGLAPQLLGVLLALPLIGVVWSRSPLPGGEKLRAATFGVVASFVFFALLGVFRLWFRAFVPWVSRKWPLRWFFEKDRPWLTEGYVHPETRAALPGHGLALATLFVGLGLYLWLGGFTPKEPASDRVPALAYVLFLLFLLNLLLSGLAFFFDRFRLPLGVGLLATAYASHLVADRDHYFELRPAAQPPVPPSAPEADAARKDRLRLAKVAAVERDPLERLGVVVCAYGGGIQAAGWTATVLSGLHREVEEFREVTRLLSGVSGGSVGAMFYVEGLERGLSFAEAPSPATRAATRSSLSAVGWGLLCQDLRSFFFLPTAGMDRAQAVEAVWRRALEGGPVDSTLSEWGRMAASGDLPAVVFNATLEDGRRLQLATVTIPETKGVDLLERFQADVDVVTAARLSATFPFVTPLARAAARVEDEWQPHPLNLYVADGGYFDNLGVTTAIEWLRSVHDEYDRVAIVEIQGFPDRPEADLPDRAAVRPLVNELAGPVEILLGARTTTQITRARLETDLLEDHRPAGFPAVEVFRFVYPEEAPFSWHLTEENKAGLTRSWERQRGKARELREWLLKTR